MLRVTDLIAIDENRLEEKFVRASGPGGQKVNKVATAVQLRVDVAALPALGAEFRQRLHRLAGRRMTADGVLIIEAQRFRTREMNRRDARARLAALIRQAAQPPPPRRKTKPTAASLRRRLDAKRRRATTKRRRARVSASEE